MCQVEEIAAVLQDLAASGIYDEVLVRSACAASAYRLADSSSAALVKLTAAMASFKHPDGGSGSRPVTSTQGHQRHAVNELSNVWSHLDRLLRLCW